MQAVANAVHLSTLDNPNERAAELAVVRTLEKQQRMLRSQFGEKI